MSERLRVTEIELEGLVQVRAGQAEEEKTSSESESTEKPVSDVKESGKIVGTGNSKTVILDKQSEYSQSLKSEVSDKSQPVDKRIDLRGHSVIM